VSPVELSGKTVLIVDDDVRNIFSLTSVLEEHGMTVSFAENGKDAIAKLESTQGIDLVLMDVMMPEMDGYETMAAIRRLQGFDKMPMIALTAKAMKGDREACLAAGARAYSAQPVDPDQLLALLRHRISVHDGTGFGLSYCPAQLLFGHRLSLQPFQFRQKSVFQLVRSVTRLGGC